MFLTLTLSLHRLNVQLHESSMVYQPPIGTKDLLPLEVAQKGWMEDRVQMVFHRWGYQRIITSTLERLDTLRAGGAVRPESVLQIQTEGEALGLRPELTASIARTAVTRMAGAPLPQRLYYIANVFRRLRGEGINGSQELFQAGVELLGGNGLSADSEILLVLLDCLSTLGLRHWCIVLGEAELTRSLLMPFPDNLRNGVRRAIAHLDRVCLETMPMAEELRKRALILLDLRGEPTKVIQTLNGLDLNPNQRRLVNRLKALAELFTENTTLLQYETVSSPTTTLILDLSLIQTFDYYTGIVFEVISDIETGQRILGQGGRYDQLLGHYHPQGKDCSGIGFCLNVEELQQALLKLNQLPQEIPPIDWLVVPTTNQSRSAAFAYAQDLRKKPHPLRVEVYLEEDLEPASVRDYAHRRNIKRIAWVEDEPSGTLENRSQPFVEIINDR